METKIASKHNISTVLVCAFRYAITKKSYVVDAVIQEINTSWSHISIDDKEIICKEIRDNLGFLEPADVDKWVSLVEKYEEELNHYV